MNPAHSTQRTFKKYDHPWMFEIGDRVRFNNSTLDIKTMKRRESTESGTVYRIDTTKVAVMPDSWKKEHKRDGRLFCPTELTIIA